MSLSAGGREGEPAATEPRLGLRPLVLVSLRLRFDRFDSRLLVDIRLGLHELVGSMWHGGSFFWSGR